MEYSNINFIPYDSHINKNLFKDLAIYLSILSFITNSIWIIYLSLLKTKKKIKFELLITIFNSIFTGLAFFFILLSNGIWL